MSTRAGLLLIVCGVVSSTIASANPITVSNPSFEILPSGTPTGIGDFAFAYECCAVPDWTRSNGSDADVFLPGSQDGEFNFFNSIPDGIAVAAEDSGTLSQTVAADVVPGVTYTLQVDIGLRGDCCSPEPGSVDLLVDGVEYVATGTSPTNGNWSLYTATYTGLDADAGDAITIELKTTATQAEFDNVQLSDSLVPTPEPRLTGILLGLFVLGVLLSRRRKGALHEGSTPQVST